MDKHLHIISLTIPYPVDYGGVFDLFYKLTAMYKAGIKIHLHCFSDGRPEQHELNKYCEEVLYYPRVKGLKAISFSLPFIVRSRLNTQLNERLNADNHPILIEGVHCSSILFDKRFKSRKTVLRLHNVEYLYYRQLFRSEGRLFRKMYYLVESAILKKYERDMARRVSLVAAVSKLDENVYKNNFGAFNTRFLPVFTGFSEVESRQTNGTYCLYHGNLSVPENEKAVHWLLDNVFNEVNIPLKIAGKAPSLILREKVNDFKNVTLAADPDESDMKELISGAQCHVLPSFNVTGVKLKLINALFNGRHCIVNTDAVSGSGLSGLCHIADSANEFRKTVHVLFHKPFDADLKEQRSIILGEMFNSEKNCAQLIQWIW